MNTMKEIAKRTKPPGGSLFLASLSPRSLSLLVPHLEHLELPKDRVLWTPECLNGSQFAHFLNDGVTSLVISDEDGRSAEVGLVGKEGMTGGAAVLGVPQSPMTEIMQIGGSGFRIHATRLREILKQSPEVRDLVTRHMVFLAMQMAQIASCNALHTVDRRLARWLLMAHDRSGVNPLPLTQELLAFTLGITRPSVSIVLNVLKERRCIALRREQVEIRNRTLLERDSCTCYQSLRAMQSQQWPEKVS